MLLRLPSFAIVNLLVLTALGIQSYMGRRSKMNRTAHESTTYEEVSVPGLMAMPSVTLFPAPEGHGHHHDAYQGHNVQNLHPHDPHRNTSYGPFSRPNGVDRNDSMQPYMDPYAVDMRSFGYVEV